MSNRLKAHAETILFEGPCSYVTQDAKGFNVIVHSTNHVTHMVAASGVGLERAKVLCGRLNAYPRQSRQFHGLL